MKFSIKDFFIFCTVQVYYLFTSIKVYHANKFQRLFQEWNKVVAKHANLLNISQITLDTFKTKHEIIFKALGFISTFKLRNMFDTTTQSLKLKK